MRVIVLESEFLTLELSVEQGAMHEGDPGKEDKRSWSIKESHVPIY